MSLTRAQDTFKPGWYYNSHGQRIIGLISYQPNSKAYPFILIKKDENSEYFEKVKITNLRGFVIGTDTFTVLRNFYVEGIQDPKIKVSAGIVQVLELGKVILYKSLYVEVFKHYPYPANPSIVPIYKDPTVIETYLLQQTGKETVIAVREEQDEFIDQMAFYFNMNEELSSRIKNREFSILKIQKLVAEFNEWYKKRKSS